jgi:hypothetical protein
VGGRRFADRSWVSSFTYARQAADHGSRRARSRRSLRSWVRGQWEGGAELRGGWTSCGRAANSSTVVFSRRSRPHPGGNSIDVMFRGFARSRNDFGGGVSGVFGVQLG